MGFWANGCVGGELAQNSVGPKWSHLSGKSFPERRSSPARGNAVHEEPPQIDALPLVGPPSGDGSHEGEFVGWVQPWWETGGDSIPAKRGGVGFPGIQRDGLAPMSQNAVFSR